MRAGFSKESVRISLDIAASEWYENGNYLLPKTGKLYTTEQLTAQIGEWISRYDLLSVEDPLGEDDLKGFRTMTGAYGDRALIVGDDLFVTNTRKLKEGIDACAANAILIKPNQIGTVSETLRVIDLARKNGYAYIMSHRSGETEDTFIADLAVATAAPLIKSGAPCRSERVAKYNRLLAISEEMGQNVRYGL